MIGAVRPQAHHRSRVPAPLVAAIVIAWAAAIAAELTGATHALHHDSLIEGDLPLWVALGLFVLAWQLMVIAMMMPSSLPLVRLFHLAAARQPRGAAADIALVGGYAVVWTIFGLVAFMLDLGVHRTVDGWPWLAGHPQLIAGSVLLLAGSFQFSGLKDRCLRECRHPGPFLMQHYGRGLGNAFRLGTAHGVFCLGCCWALVLVGFAAGVANLWWMAALTAIMVYEKVGRRGREAVVWIGAALIVLGVLTLAVPTGLFVNG